MEFKFETENSAIEVEMNRRFMEWTCGGSLREFGIGNWP